MFYSTQSIKDFRSNSFRMSRSFRLSWKRRKEGSNWQLRPRQKLNKEENLIRAIEKLLQDGTEARCRPVYWMPEGPIWTIGQKSGFRDVCKQLNFRLAPQEEQQLGNVTKPRQSCFIFDCKSWKFRSDDMQSGIPAEDLQPANQPIAYILRRNRFVYWTTLYYSH